MTSQPQTFFAADLRAWQVRMGYTYDSAAEALGMSRSGYAKLLSGKSKIDHRTALACAALAVGMSLWRHKDDHAQ